MSARKQALLLLLIIVTFTLSCQKDHYQEPTEALESHLILLNSYLSANIDTLNTDSSLTVIDNEAIMGVLPIEQSNQISLDVVSPNSNVIAVGLRFGTSKTIHFSNTPYVYFALSGNICETLTPICHPIKIYEYGLTSEGKISLPKTQDAIIICGSCCDNSINHSTGKDGNPRFNLRFSQGAELHLYVEGPDGQQINYLNRTDTIQSLTPGIMDIAWTCMDCSIGANENIYWDNGLPGSYKFYVAYEDFCVSNINARFEVTVRNGGKEVMTQSGTLSPNHQSLSWTYIKP